MQRSLSSGLVRMGQISKYLGGDEGLLTLKCVATSSLQLATFASKMPKGMQSTVGSKAEIWGAKYIKPSMVSSNVLAEPYKGPKKQLPLSSYFTPSGWGIRWNRWKDSWKSMYSLSKLKKSKNWNLRDFKLDALETYTSVCDALAKADLSKLRQLATPAIYSDMKKQLKHREKANWHRVEWRMVEKPDLYDVQLVQARVIAADQKNDETAFVQLTVRIPSTQAFKAYNKNGDIVAGGDDVFQVVDHWVFEQSLSSKSQQKYKVAARLHIDEK